MTIQDELNRYHIVIYLVSFYVTFSTSRHQNEVKNIDIRKISSSHLLNMSGHQEDNYLLYQGTKIHPINVLSTCLSSQVMHGQPVAREDILS
jgi:hypothetical protein